MKEERGPFQQEVHGNQNAISIYGDASTHIYPPPVPSELPERVWMIPYRRNAFFTGREPVLTRLHECFTTDREAVLTQGQANNGLGGIGKTQVAVEYAYRHREEYRFVLWANASTEQTLIAAYLSIADRLHLPERTLPEQENIVAAVLHWLATHERWLLILDNADELERVWSLLPTGSTGHVLLTTRDHMVGEMQNFLVEEMDRREGTLFLLRRAHFLTPEMRVEQVSQGDRQIAEQIVEAMDGLPLALDQAGAYIEETKCRLSDYQQRYQTRRVWLLQRRGRRATDHPDAVAATWSLAFEKVEQANPAAADLLRLCAFLAPDAIPEEIITESAADLGPVLEPVASDAVDLDEAIAALGAYSLVHRNATEKTLSVHRLVQAVLKDQMDEQDRQQWAQRAVQAVNAAFPEVKFETWLQCERCLPHAQACMILIEQERLTIPEAADLLTSMGWYLGERGRYTEAESPLQHAMTIREQQSEVEDLQTAYTATTLGWLCEYQGKYAQAEPLYQRALSICEQQLGAEHPTTASSLNNLAGLYRMQGKYEQAEPLYLRALTIQEQQLGERHPDTAMSLNDLAELYRVQGKYSQAEPLYQRALSIREQQLGPQHPDTALSLNNLALLYSAQGKDKQAEPLYLRMLSTYEQQLGPDHPDTATGLNNLATLYHHQGKYEQAEPLLVRALAIHEQQLGPEHPNTATSLNNLALLSCTQGKYEQAEHLLQRALSICEHALGPQHPHTQTARASYADLLRTMGHDAEAAAPDPP